MVTRIIVSVAAVLVLGAGVAYAATELMSSDGTQVCVNSANGLVRVATTCREGEYPLMIGGGSTVFSTFQVTQDYNQQDGAYLGPVSVTVACNTGERVVGGGGIATNEKYNYTGYLTASRPSADDSSWIARFDLPDGVSHATAYAVCAG